MCFEVERRLQDAVGIPVFHDDQHGTAIVVLAAALERGARRRAAARRDDGHRARRRRRRVGVRPPARRGRRRRHHRLRPRRRAAPGHGRAQRRQALVRRAHQPRRPDRWRPRRRARAPTCCSGSPGPGIVAPAMLADMADDAIVFAMANPVPEVMPCDVPGNVAVVATGRSDFPNQINNVLAFPGVFRGLLDAGARRCTTAMKLAGRPRARRPRAGPDAGRASSRARVRPSASAEADRGGRCRRVAAVRERRGRRCLTPSECVVRGGRTAGTPMTAHTRMGRIVSRVRTGWRARRSCWRRRGPPTAGGPARSRTAVGGRAGRAAPGRGRCASRPAPTWAYSARTPVT